MLESLTTQADEVLLRTLQPKRDDAFDVLVSRYKDRLISLAQWLLGDAETAWAIVQKVFVRLYFAPRAAQRIHRTSVWLYAETLRMVRGYQRKQRWASALRTVVHRRSQDRPSSTATSSPPLPPSSMTDQDKQRLVLCMLPDALKEVYVLCDLQGLSLEEVGSILRLSAAEVQAQIEKARVVFREFLYQKQEGD